MRTRLLIWILAGALALPAALVGQEHRERHDRLASQSAMMMGTGQEHAMIGIGMMIQPGSDFLLEQKEALKLTDEQLQRLQELEDELSALHQAHMSQVMPQRQRATEALHAEQPDLDAYESALEAWAAEHVRMQVAMARYWQRALAVLNDEQRSNLHFGLHLMHQMRGQMGEGMKRGGMTESHEDGGH
ncbi:MAG: Spy/CpxP family protein refolding chaperone [Gemmatimonadota bacterium]|nr:MAG: Spy/CpxP family protein refolding chaperone [Gemmatimonadota bacterium]